MIRGATAARATNALEDGTFSTFSAAHSDSYRTPAELHEASHQSAFTTGYNDGLAQARADIAAATEDANNRVRYALSALQVAIDSFEQRDAVSLVEIEDVVARTAVEIASEILQREVGVSRNPGTEAIARAMRLAPARGEVVVRLHPSDFETLGMSTLDAHGREIQLVADVNVERGGCLATIGDTTIDAQISTALQRVRIALGVDQTELLGSRKRYIDESAIAKCDVLHENDTDATPRQYVKKLTPTKGKNATGRRSKQPRKASSEAPDQ